MRALLLLLVSTAAYADKAAVATDRLRTVVPDDAELRAETEVVDDALGAITYDLAKDDAAIDIQRSVPDGACATVVDAAAKAITRMVETDAGKSLVLTVAREGNAVISSGKQQGSHGWRATAIATTCLANEVVTITAMANAASTPEATARMAAIARNALAGLAPIGVLPTVRVPVDGIHTIEIPAPAYHKKVQAYGFVTYVVPGFATFGIAREAVTTNCETWLAKMQHGLEQEAKDKDEMMQTVGVERVGDIVLRVARQKGIKAAVAGRWFANVSASTCRDGLAFTLAGTSYDGALVQPELPEATAGRLKAQLVRAAQSVR